MNKYDFSIRKEREGDREAILAALVCRTFHDHTMIFVQTKKQAHRLHILLGLLGLKVNKLIILMKLITFIYYFYLFFYT